MTEDKTTSLTLWGGEDTAQSRRPRAWRACECGCDNRGRDVPIVGYVSGSDRKGRGVTIYAPDEETYQRFVAVFGEGA